MNRQDRLGNEVRDGARGPYDTRGIVGHDSGGVFSVTHPRQRRVRREIAPDETVHVREGDEFEVKAKPQAKPPKLEQRDGLFKRARQRVKSFGRRG